MRHSSLPPEPRGVPSSEISTRDTILHPRRSRLWRWVAQQLPGCTGGPFHCPRGLCNGSELSQDGVGNQPIHHTFPTAPASRTLFIPSFQSPDTSGQSVFPKPQAGINLTRQQCSMDAGFLSGHPRNAKALPVLPAAGALHPQIPLHTLPNGISSPSHSTYLAAAKGSQSRSSANRVRMPLLESGCHQCWTSPSTYC